MTSRDRPQPPAVQRTKLHRPPVPPDLVHREELLELMAGAEGTPATLVCAPAGYGKSVLVSEWLEEAQRDHVWLSLGEAETDLRLFLTYVLAGIEDVAPKACEETRSLVEAPELPPVATLVRSLGNELESLCSPLTLALDDYHLLEPTSAVHELLGRLLEHPSRNLRIVLIARRDPPLELFKLRADARLTEIRTRDLRFTPADTAELIRQSAGLEVSRAALENLHRGVEGWAVGLRLVLAALRHARDADDLLLGLEGGLPSIQEYLLREVLAALPAELRRVAELSALFERFCPELLDAVVSRDLGERSSEVVARFWELTGKGHLFVIPLDDKGRWKRYHHQLRDLLRDELHRQLTDAEVAALHLRASAWFEENGEIDEALDHALSANDAELAADIVGRQRHAVFDRDRWYVVERWLNRLPRELEEKRLDLMVTRTKLLENRHELLAMAELAQRASSRLDGPEADPRLRAELDVCLGFIDVFLHCNGEQGLERLERAQPHLPDSSMLRGQHGFYLLQARQLIGDGEAGMKALAQQIRSTDPTEVDLLSRWILGHAVVGLLRGDLVTVERSALRLLDLVQGTGRWSVEAWGHYLEASVRYHRNEPEKAARAFDAAAARPHLLNNRILLDALAASALCHQSLGRDDLADRALEQLEELTRQSEAHHLDVVDACRAHLRLRRGDVPSALAWARSFEREPHPGSILFALEVPVLTQVRVWIESGSRDDLARALARLEELRALVTRLHFDGQLQDTEALRAVALARSGQRSEARDVLADWLDRSTSQGWIRPLVEAGPTMLELIAELRQETRDASRRAELDRLLASLEAPPGPAGVPGVPGVEERPTPGGTDPGLTQRELEVLELLPHRLQDKEIAARLGISSYTVKDHLKRIYQKMSVSGRHEAADKAVHLGLVKDPGGRRPDLPA